MSSVDIISKDFESNDPVNGQEFCNLVQLDGEWFNKITHSHRLPEFMMALTSSSDHWMFVSSCGALTAGRRNADNAIFPYYSAEKITDTRKRTAPLTIIQIRGGGGYKQWRPFWETSIDERSITRNLYKSPMGNKLVLEECHRSLGLVFRYQWAFSHQFGCVRSAKLINTSSLSRQIRVVDGFQNIVPYGVDQNFQLQFGNLIDAYKKSELIESGLGVFYLSSIPTDRAEPSEGLRATVAWSPQTAKHVLLSDQQIDTFLDGGAILTESDVRGRRGAFLTYFEFELVEGQQKNWDLVIDTELDQTDVINLAGTVGAANIADILAEEIDRCENRLAEIVAKCDGFQISQRAGKSLRHRSNVMFNVMRGGLPADGYSIDTSDLLAHLQATNPNVAERNKAALQQLEPSIRRDALIALVDQLNDPHLKRIVNEYLPFVFGRRHGDPTRPWNKFSIDSHVAGNDRSFDYQGNWRDIFQNWEALAFAYPQFAQAMISRFVNATTADGYNPYRLTKAGFEWESPEPENPWANIGYWGDHQIIYLCKLLELSTQFCPGQIQSMLSDSSFVYANVPYRIKPVEEIFKDPRDTVEFDAELSNSLVGEASINGHDAKLLKTAAGEIVTANLTEKLLLTFLVKMSNFVPDGGVWLNTQRPEWNDANNALVGFGLSVVTTCYLYRYAGLMQQSFNGQAEDQTFEVHADVAELMREVQLAISPYVAGDADVAIAAAQRHQIVMDLSNAGSKYRERIYSRGMTGTHVQVDVNELAKFFEGCRRLLANTIRSNRRADGLYHSYNLMSLDVADEIQIERLYEMLEGQVAVLSSGMLSAAESVEVLDALRRSRLYRADQDSYMLYPNRQLPRFIEKNVVPSGLVNQSPLLQELLKAGDESVIRRDRLGNYHFNGDFRNRKDVEIAVARLDEDERYQPFLTGAAEQICNIFENIFCHHQFTGRSGTFFAYEGLGSIYWHMVSKLLLAVAEIYAKAKSLNTDPSVLAALMSHFREIQNGLGMEKTAAEYGAFTSDPYSHTPENAGAQQPGMTGQVKEDILWRYLEIGVRIDQGQVRFEPSLLPANEFSKEPQGWRIWDFKNSVLKTETVPAGQFAFTLCGVGVYYSPSDLLQLKIEYSDGRIELSDRLELSQQQSAELFARTGQIQRIEVSFPVDEFLKS